MSQDAVWRISASRRRWNVTIDVQTERYDFTLLSEGDAGSMPAIDQPVRGQKNKVHGAGIVAGFTIQRTRDQVRNFRPYA